MRLINYSYKVGCLQCSFNDKEMNEYIQVKKRRSELQRKRSVHTVGKQGDGTWIFGEDICVSPTGHLLTRIESNYIWISNIYNGPGIPSPTMACKVNLPLSTQPLKRLLSTLSVRLGHNFYSALLLIGAAAYVLHYEELIKKLRFCPIPLAFGISGTGKTTALECALSLFGARESRLYSKITLAKMFDLCCECPGIPIGIDDPHSKNDINKLLVDLYNGKKGSNVGKGDHVPLSTVIISSNFSPSDRGRLVNTFIFFASTVIMAVIIACMLQVCLEMSDDTF